MAANYLGKIVQYGLVALMGFGSSAAYASRSDASRLERYTVGLSTESTRKVELAQDYSSLEGHLFAKTVPDKEHGTFSVGVEVGVNVGVAEAKVEAEYTGGCTLIPDKIGEGNAGSGSGSGSGNGTDKADGPL